MAYGCCLHYMHMHMRMCMCKCMHMHMHVTHMATGSITYGDRWAAACLMQAVGVAPTKSVDTN